MQCSACTATAAQVAKRHGVCVRVCSEQCGRQLLAGIGRGHTDGIVHVASHSPIGRVIAAKTGLKQAAFALPDHVVSRIGAAMQRIGPAQKRAASAADLPESEQAAAPVPAVDWMAELPADVWREVFKLLSPEDLGAVGATSLRAANRMRDRTVQAAMVRRNMRASTAFVKYMDETTPDSQKAAIRAAYPFIAEMCVAYLGQFLSRSVTVDDADLRLFRKFRTEAGLDGRELFVRPIHAAADLDIEGDVVKVMFAALRWTSFMHTDPDYRPNRFDVMLAPDARDGDLLETPETICFFAIQLLLEESRYTRNTRPYRPWPTFPMEWFRHRGVDTTRHNFYVWFYCSFLSDPRQSAMSTVLTYMETAPDLAFPLPTKRGQVTALMLGMQLIDFIEVRLDVLLGIMMDADAFYDNVMAPLVYGDPLQELMLFKSDDPRFSKIFTGLFRFLMSDRVTAMLEEKSRVDPFAVRNAANQLPIEHLLLHYSVSEIRFHIELESRKSTRFAGLRLGLFEPLSTNPSMPIIMSLPLQMHRRLFEVLWKPTHATPPPIDAGGMTYLLHLINLIRTEAVDTKLEAAINARAILAMFTVSDEHMVTVVRAWKQIPAFASAHWATYDMQVLDDQLRDDPGTD